MLRQNKNDTILYGNLSLANILSDKQLYGYIKNMTARGPNFPNCIIIVVFKVPAFIENLPNDDLYMLENSVHCTTKNDKMSMNTHITPQTANQLNLKTIKITDVSKSACLSK